MQSATPMKTDNVSATACITFIDDTNDQADFEYFDQEEHAKQGVEEVEEVPKKNKTSPPSTSDILLTHSKQIQAFVGPSCLYLVMKGMKLKGSEVTTIKFLPAVPRFAIPIYLSTRPNVKKIITDYGPIACTWPEFAAVRSNLSSFVVRSGTNFFYICDIIML